MVSYSPSLVRYAVGALNAVETNDRTKFDAQMAGLNETYESINKEMEMMWSRSMPEDYIKFRTFIMGTKNQVRVKNNLSFFFFMFARYLICFFYYSPCSPMVLFTKV